MGTARATTATSHTLNSHPRRKESDAVAEDFADDEEEEEENCWVCDGW